MGLKIGFILIFVGFCFARMSFRKYWSVGTGICNKLWWMLCIPNALEIRRHYSSAASAQLILFGSCRQKKYLLADYFSQLRSSVMRTCINWYSQTNRICDSFFGFTVSFESTWVWFPVLIPAARWHPVLSQLGILAVDCPISCLMLMPSFLIILMTWRSIGI